MTLSFNKDRFPHLLPNIFDFVATLDDEKTYELTIAPVKKKRSLDANAMAWKLLRDLSVVLRISPEELYRNYIPDVGGNYEIVPVRADRLQEWDRVWCEGHDGRLTVDMGECRTIPGYHYMRSYLGSSDYDTSQMSRLLDLIIDDCRENGIEVISDRERSLLLTEWGKGHE